MENAPLMLHQKFQPQISSLSEAIVTYLSHMVTCTVLQAKRVHFAFWHKLVHNFKITGRMEKQETEN